ncbi:MAG: hypothetical protein IH860_00825 [Chloroflexi bacterium]|nr:hypothetical protein [Chloroflexota bacterium]
MSQGTLKSERPGSWDAELLRLTTFLRSEPDISESERWWEKVVGGRPDETVSRPGLGQLRQTGKLVGKLLAISVNLARVDWVLQAPLPNPTEPPEEPSPLGPFPDVLKPFEDVVNSWLEKCPAVARLAFGAVLVLPVKDHLSGYRRLAQFLPDLKIDADGSSDLLYQINRPRKSGTDISGLIINRLSKWSVSRGTLLRISLEPGATSTISRGTFRFACRAELDINTAADFDGDFSRESLPFVFDELTRLGKEISVKGDIP